MIACASAGTLAGAGSQRKDSLPRVRCSSCDDDSRCNVSAAKTEHSELLEVTQTVLNLIKLSRTQKYRRPHVAAMLAIKRLLSHTTNADHLDLGQSPFGQWCLQALHSSVRELRIAAGSVMSEPAFHYRELMAAGGLCQSFFKRLLPPLT